MLRSDLKVQETLPGIDQMQKKSSGSLTTHLHQPCFVLENPLATSPPSQDRQTLPYRNGFLQLFGLKIKSIKGRIKKIYIKTVQKHNK